MKKTALTPLFSYITSHIHQRVYKYTEYIKKPLVIEITHI